MPDEDAFEHWLIVAFIASWFTAIWIFHWQLFLTGLFAFILGVILYEKE